MSTHTSILFSDAMISFLMENKTWSDMITKLKNFVKDEEFETDSIYMDIEDNIGNIANHIKNESFIMSISQFIKTNKSMSSLLYGSFFCPFNFMIFNDCCYFSQCFIISNWI